MSQPYTWPEIEYLEKPVTADERGIAVVLEGALKASTEYDLQLLSSVISDDAMIVLSPRAVNPISKTEYLQKMEKISASIRNMKYKNVLIRMKNSNEASASCILYVRFKNFKEVLVNRFFEFKKEGIIWKIVRVSY